MFVVELMYREDIKTEKNEPKQFKAQEPAFAKSSLFYP